jgi:hypothetical protein
VSPPKLYRFVDWDFIIAGVFVAKERKTSVFGVALAGVRLVPLYLFAGFVQYPLAGPERLEDGSLGLFIGWPVRHWQADG